MNHPLHPLLVHLPIGLWLASFIFDIAYAISANPLFASVSYCCMGAGVLGALLAIPAGLAEYIEIPHKTRAKRLAVAHLLLSLLVTSLYGINFASRSMMFKGIPMAISRGQWVLSLFSILVFGISGYLGGLLVYEYGIGFRPELRNRRKADSQTLNDDIGRAA